MMLNRIALRLFVIALLIGNVSQATAGTPIVVSADEVWDGILNPRSGDGVTLAGGVYTVPHELQIASGTTIFLNDPATAFDQAGNVPTGSIGFDFSTGTAGLTFADSTSLLDIHPGTRNVGGTTFTLNMGSNDIVGLGQIANGPALVGQTGDPMSVVINSLGNITLSAIKTSKSDAASGNITITAEGFLDIGSLSTSDASSGGGSAGSIVIKGQAITLGDIDTTSQRTVPGADMGSLTVAALDPPSFDPNNAVGNGAGQNLLNLTGSINTNGPLANDSGGNVSLTGVKVTLASGFSLDLAETATSSINAGVIGGGFSAGDLFMDESGSGLSASNTVEHFIPEPSTLAMIFCGGLAFVGRRRR